MFGLAASPFVLNYVLKYHINKYKNDICSQVLLSSFYVDNLIVTNSDPQILESIYKMSVERLAEGGFELRSWN